MEPHDPIESAQTQRGGGPSSGASAAGSRNALSLACCVIVAACVSAGLLLWQPSVQSGVIVGATAGLIASSYAWAATTGVLGLAVGTTITIAGRSGFGAFSATQVTSMAIGVGVAAVVAVFVAWVIRRRRSAATIIYWTVIALLIGNLWATSLVVDSWPTRDKFTGEVGASVFEQLSGDVLPQYADGDATFFYMLSRSLASGRSYYEAFRESFVEWTAVAPSSATNFRFPLIGYVWSVLPGASLIWAFLALASVTTVCAVVALARVVRVPLTIPVAAALLSHFMYFTTGVSVYDSEAWTACFAVMSVAAWLMAERDGRGEAWVWFAALTALLAVLIREVAIFLPLAGLVAAVFVASPRRKSYVMAWGTASALAFALLAVHFFVAQRYVDPASTYDQFARGSLAWVVEGLRYGTDFTGDAVWFPLVLAVMGLVGIAFMPSKSLRVYLGLYSAATLGSFLFLANSAINTGTGRSMNYWGEVLVPVLYVVMPLVFLVVPAARASRLRATTDSYVDEREPAAAIRTAWSAEHQPQGPWTPASCSKGL